jgi:hypothetical protein
MVTTAIVVLLFWRPAGRVCGSCPHRWVRALSPDARPHPCGRDHLGPVSAPAELRSAGVRSRLETYEPLRRF